MCTINVQISKITVLLLSTYEKKEEMDFVAMGQCARSTHYEFLKRVVVSSHAHAQVHKFNRNKYFSRNGIYSNVAAFVPTRSIKYEKPVANSR